MKQTTENFYYHDRPSLSVEGASKPENNFAKPNTAI